MNMTMQMKMKIPDMQVDFFRKRMKTLTQIKMKSRDMQMNSTRMKMHMQIEKIRFGLENHCSA